MFNIIMEPTVDENATFVELQSIKKEEFFGDNLADVLVSPISNNSLHREQNSINNGDVDENVSDICIIENIYSCNNQEVVAAAPSNSKKVKQPLKRNKVKKLSKAPSFNKKIKSKLKNSKKRANNAAKTSSSSGSNGKKPKCEYPRLCSGCGHAYKTKQSFWNHKQRCPMLPQNMRNNRVDQNGLPVEGSAADGEFVRRKEYICAHCERHYRKKYNLREHLKNTCRGKPCSKGRLQCWQPGCVQAFYKYVDLVQHVTLQHGQDLQIQKLQFPNFSAFNTWKTEESNSKFMYARKITGSKRFSNTKYHYYVCQFNHRNEKKNHNRKTNRRKKDSLVVPNYNCPSRIMVKECENQILVTYISSHNHELNLSNVKYQPLEKETRAYIKTLLQLGVTPKKIIDHLRAGVGNPEIDSFLTTKQHFLTLNRIKRMESKLKAKTRARELELEAESNVVMVKMCDSDCYVPEEPYSSCENVLDGNDTGGNSMDSASVNLSPTSLCRPEGGATYQKNCQKSSAATPSLPPTKSNSSAHPKESDEIFRSIESNLKKLKGYMHKNTIKEKLSSRISKMIQELCDECESLESSNTSAPPVVGVTSHPTAARKPRVSKQNRKRKNASFETKTATSSTTAATTSINAAKVIGAATHTQPADTMVSIAVPAVAVAATITAALPVQQHTTHVMQPIMIHHQQPLQTHHHQIHHLTDAPQHVNSIAGGNHEQILNTLTAADPAAAHHHKKPFTPAINEATNLLKPLFQPFNVNLLCLKSLDRHISPQEQLLLKQVDEQFSAGFLYDAVVNSFLNLVCRSLTNVLAADSGITEFVQLHQKVPDVWHCFNWADIDTVFIPCNPSKKQWILMVVLVKQLEVQILDPTGDYEDEDAILSVYKKHETTIQCWYEVLRSFLGIGQWNVTSPQHTKHPDPVNSGALVCWYVLQYVNKQRLTEDVDTDRMFRQFVFNTIVNTSSPA